MVFSKVFSAITEIIENTQFDSKVICNEQQVAIVTKVQQGSPILFIAKDRPKLSLIAIKAFLGTHENSASHFHHVYLIHICYFEEERVKQQSRDKYFPQFENQGINPVGGTHKSPIYAPAQTNKQTLAPNTIMGLSIPSRSLARMRSDRDRYKRLLKRETK